MDNDRLDGAKVAFQLGVMATIATGVASGDSAEKVWKDVEAYSWNMLKFWVKVWLNILTWGVAIIALALYLAVKW